jgi:rod shape-determining protein MreC
MLWEYISRYKVSFSLGFCIVFSLTSILWQKNPISYSSIYFNKISEQANYFFKNIFQFPFILIERIAEYSELKEKYQKSLEEIEKYKLQKEQYELLLKENQKLKQLLEFEPLTNYPEIKAQILGIRLNSITPRIIIDKGKKQGIEPMMPVIAFTSDENNHPIRAVVGITAIVQDSTSIIQPIQHPQMNLGVKIENTNQWAILEGDSFSYTKLRLKYITHYSHKNEKFFKDPFIEIQNSRVVTSGNDGIFPPNLFVGIIVEKGSFDENNFSTAYVRPYIEIDKLDYVIVLLKKPKEWATNSYNTDSNESLEISITDFIPEELIKNYKEQSEHKKHSTQSSNKDNNQSQKEENNDKNQQYEEKQNFKKQERILNPNDPFQ